MKNINYLIISLVFLLIFSGCYELDRYPNDKLSAGTFWQTKDHADQAMAGVYSVTQSAYVFGIVFGLDCLSDIGTGYDAAAYDAIARGTYTATTDRVTNKWSTLYEGIARANLVMQNIGNISEDEMNDELKTQYIAEAKLCVRFFIFSCSIFLEECHSMMKQSLFRKALAE